MGQEKKRNRKGNEMKETKCDKNREKEERKKERRMGGKNK